MLGFRTCGSMRLGTWGPAFHSFWEQCPATCRAVPPSGGHRLCCHPQRQRLASSPLVAQYPHWNIGEKDPLKILWNIFIYYKPDLFRMALPLTLNLCDHLRRRMTPNVKNNTVIKCVITALLGENFKVLTFKLDGLRIGDIYNKPQIDPHLLLLVLLVYHLPLPARSRFVVTRPVFFAVILN